MPYLGCHSHRPHVSLVTIVWAILLSRAGAAAPYACWNTSGHQPRARVPWPHCKHPSFIHPVLQLNGYPGAHGRRANWLHCMHTLCTSLSTGKCDVTLHNSR
jgi:hypothetical protein